ncbi:unnamed protein product, partial [Symbiodinium necroappetens]
SVGCSSCTATCSWRTAVRRWLWSEDGSRRFLHSSGCWLGFQPEALQDRGTLHHADDPAVPRLDQIGREGFRAAAQAAESPDAGRKRCADRQDGGWGALLRGHRAGKDRQRRAVFRNMEVAFVAPVTSKSLPTAQLASSAPAPQGPSSPSTLLGGSAALGAAAVVALASSSGRRRVARRAEQELAKLPKHMQPVDMN